MKRSQPTLDQLFEKQIQILATTLRPRTVQQYRSWVRGFLAYLHASFLTSTNFPNYAVIPIC